MAPSVFLLCILFTIGFLLDNSVGISELELNLGFAVEPDDVIGVKGKPLTLPCRPWTSRQTNLTILWFHDDVRLTNDSRREILNDGSLFFKKLHHYKRHTAGGYSGQSDQGEYRCVVESQYGSLTSRTAFLRISVLHEFLENPVSQTVEEGTNVRLSCAIEWTPEVTIVWERNELELPQNDVKYSVISGPGAQGSVLFIFNVVPDDSGRYRCTASNVLTNKQRNSSSGELTVVPSRGSQHRPLTFLTSSSTSSTPPSSPSSKIVKEGDDVTLECVVNAYPIPTLTWSFVQNDGYKPKNVFNATKTGSNIVIIRNVTRNQSGWYICSAMNPSHAQQTTILDVQTPPEFLVKPENTVFHAAKTIRFRCSAYGNPVPEVSWMKDGSPVHVNGRIKHKTIVNATGLRTSELLLSTTIASDSGIYQCVLVNSVRTVWAASRLFLNATRAPPSPPEKVSCKSLSDSEVEVFWDVASTVKDVKAFSIHFTLSDTFEERQEVAPPTNRSTVINKLLPYVNYTFGVRVYTDSASDFSCIVMCQTGEEVPIAAPEIKLESTSPNSIHVSWSPLPDVKSRGVITEYKIQWRLRHSPSTKVAEVKSNVLDYTITGVTPGKAYEIRVLAATSKGWPTNPKLPWVTFQVPEKQSSNTPPAPTVLLQAVNSSSIEVVWNISQGEFQLQGYKLYYRQQNSNQEGPILVPVNTTEYTLTDLGAETSYEVMVLGYTSHGDGEIGVNSIHTLPDVVTSETTPHQTASVPEPPVSLEAAPISPVAINLTWSLPQSVSGANNVSYYTVCYNPVQTSLNVNESSINCLQSSKNEISVSSLKPFTLYEFKVRSHDVNERHSVYSQIVECHTLEDLPSAVLEVHYKVLNKTAVRVTWKEPLKSNGVLKAYTISYSPDPDLPIESWQTKVVQGNSYNTEIADLIPNTNYYLIVRASTNAGFGPHSGMAIILMASQKSVAGVDSPKTMKDKPNDQHIGIIVGLAIGLSCIIMCALCIICRRRCVKNQVPQEPAPAPGRNTNGANCHRDRQLGSETHEMEYFTYLSTQSGTNENTEPTPQHIDTKGHYPNGFVNGARLSLLGDGRVPNGSLVRGHIHITENPRYDPNSTESPLLGLQTLSSSRLENDLTLDSSSMMTERLKDSTVPLLTVKRKFSETEKSSSLSYNDSESEAEETTKNSTVHSDSVQGLLLKNQGNLILQNDIESAKNNNKFLYGENFCNQRLNENGRCVKKNHVLENPDFRFSDSNTSDKRQIKRNGYLIPDNYTFCNGTSEVHHGNDEPNLNAAVTIKPKLITGLKTLQP